MSREVISPFSRFNSVWSITYPGSINHEIHLFELQNIPLCHSHCPIPDRRGALCVHATLSGLHTREIPLKNISSLLNFTDEQHILSHNSLALNSAEQSQKDLKSLEKPSQRDEYKFRFIFVEHQSLNKRTLRS